MNVEFNERRVDLDIYLTEKIIGELYQTVLLAMFKVPLLVINTDSTVWSTDRRLAVPATTELPVSDIAIMKQNVYI